MCTSQHAATCLSTVGAASLTHCVIAQHPVINAHRVCQLTLCSLGTTLCSPLTTLCLWGRTQLAWALQVCSETIIGNDMIRGVSGGQRKRVTTGMPTIRFCRQDSKLPHSPSRAIRCLCCTAACATPVLTALQTRLTVLPVSRLTNTIRASSPKPSALCY